MFLYKRQGCETWQTENMQNEAPFWKAESKYDTQYVIYSSCGKLADVLGLL